MSTGTPTRSSADGRAVSIMARVAQTPRPRELQALALSLKSGQKVAAYEMGISVQTAKNLLTALYHKLDVGTSAQAAIALGWLAIPDVR